MTNVIQWGYDDTTSARKGVSIIANTKTIHIRLDETKKREATAVLEKIGLTMSAAINMFLSQVVIQQKLPFEAIAERRPSAELLAAFEEIEAAERGEIGFETYNNADEMVIACLSDTDEDDSDEDKARYQQIIAECEKRLAVKR